MTDFHVEIVRLGPIEKLKNADTLGLTMVGAYPVIVRLGEYQENDLAVYVPVDSVVPLTDPRWSFLDGKDRIRSKKLRGTFSQGLLTPIDPSWPDIQVGLDVSERMRINKYLTAEERNEFGSQAFQNPKQRKPCPESLPRYTDIENLRRHANIFAPGQIVIATEKIEGQSVAYCYNAPTTWQRFKGWLGFSLPDAVLCRSRNEMKVSGKWYELIDKLDLKSRFENLEDPESYSIYGETYGYTKGFHYDTGGENHFRVFDVWDRVTKHYLDLDEAWHVCEAMGLDMAPILYRGPFDMQLLEELAEQDSSFGDHISEGLVIRSETEQNVPHFGRLITKLKSQRYLLRKD